MYSTRPVKGAVLAAYHYIEGHALTLRKKPPYRPRSSIQLAHSVASHASLAHCNCTLLYLCPPISHPKDILKDIHVLYGCIFSSVTWSMLYLCKSFTLNFEIHIFSSLFPAGPLVQLVNKQPGCLSSKLHVPASRPSE